MKRWIIATRPWSFPASAMPALTIMVYLMWQQQMTDSVMDLNYWGGFLAIVGVVLFQAAGNLISDYYDYKYGVDRPETFGSARLIVDGVFKPTTILIYGIIVLYFGVFIGIYLIFTCGLQLLWIGGVGIVGTYFYYFFKYRALGDLLIFILYGQLIALGMGYVMTGSLLPELLLISAPVGLLVVNILHANNTRDVMHDAHAGITTLAMRLGMRGSKVEFWLMNVLAYVAVAVFCCVGMLPWWSLLVFITWPLAWKNSVVMQNATIENLAGLRDLDGKSAQLVLLFSFVLIISLLISYFV